MTGRKVTAALLLVFSLCSFSLKEKTKLNIVFIGDSITHGAGLKSPDKEAPPVSACAFLRKQRGVGEVNFSNQGVSGFTTLDFLPATASYNRVITAADIFKKQPDGQLVFSVMLGTNDSAEKGPHGSPVSPAAYRANLRTITDHLLEAYPRCKIVLNYPIWYSPNTYNGARYLQAGLTRLQTYFPEIDRLVDAYAASHPGRVFIGDKQAFEYFKQHFQTDFQAERGHQGTFYLHPNHQGAIALGRYWGQAIYKALFGKG
ncbi:GDSL-type esterase/lipase family protein [Compostibacter hankyongensis]|uniref:SGNH/GDSL hydrolase family protein n=1 Tax=Compostibacter hankyongensis TaxID=1007089 RepID=A0ABP8FZ39_9BACT